MRPPTSPSSNDVRKHLEELLTSSVFEASERLQRFLRFVVGRALDGDAREIKEYTIGVDVYDRGPDFDPKTDALVRTEAFRLRGKLKNYYETEGRAAPFRIELRKGSYVPTFTLAAPPVASEPALAVLPFVNFDVDAAGEHFSDGLTEELIHALASLNGLRVAARTSVFQFKGRADDVREIGRRLKVDAVIEGSVRRTSTGVRVTAQLIETADGYHVWSKTFDRSVHDVVSTQEDIARAVADSLRLRFSAAVGAPRVRTHSANEEALRLYLRARYLVRQWSPESLELSLACLAQAIALDPRYAAAHATVAESLSYLLYFGIAPTQAIVKQLRHAAETALALDPTAPEAHVALGIAHALADHQWMAAERCFECALEHQPGNVNGHAWLAYTVLLPQRRFEEAEWHMERAMALDPLDPVLNIAYANLPFWQGDSDTALERYGKTLELDPNFPQTRWNLAYLEEFTGRSDQALADYRRAADLFGATTPPRLLADLARLLARTGKRDEAHAIHQRLTALGAQAYVPASAMAWIELGLGCTDAVLTWLERAYEERDLFLIWATVDPRYDSVRRLERFKALLGRMNLPLRASGDQ